MRPEYRYRCDGDGHIWSGPNEVWRPGATMSLDGVRTPTWLGPFSPRGRDLLRVMAAVLQSDRLSPRRPSTKPRQQREVAWQRRIELQVAVEAPDLWLAAASQVQELLSFMTDDEWELQFAPISTRAGHQQLLPFAAAEQATEVALFSGGLDSVAGLFASSRPPGTCVLAVSACGNEVRGAAQQTALKALRGVGATAAWLKVDHQLRGARRSRSRMEASQRSRGLFFLAMGAVAAAQVRLPTFSVYETGVGCINLPTSSAQVGAQGTRAMHPRTLELFNRLAATVLDHPIRVVAPFFLHTKGELCRLAGNALEQLARVSMSCDEGEGHKPDAMLHCGLCTSCLFRRIALHSAGLTPDSTPYRDEATRRHGVYELRALENHAAQLSACRVFDDLVELDPDARFASSIPLTEPTSSDAGATAVLSMYRRYAAEIEAYFLAARPTVARRIPQRRKELDRGLFSAAG